MRHIKTLKKTVAYSLLATMVASLCPMQASAYGETTEKSTLVTDTKALSDYQTWKTEEWTGKESADSAKIVLTPGATEKDVNFAWYSLEKGNPAVKVGQKEDLSDAVIYEGTATQINRSNAYNTYTASNKVSITGVFEKNTTYYYSYTSDGETWSEAKSYVTKDSSEYKIVLVGDPQVGASGSDGQGTEDDINIAVDTYNWNKTLTKVQEKETDASFILSVGDQIDYSGVDSADTKNVRESEYAGFLYPSLLRNLPLATSIGNHESLGTDYKYHYNNPNSSDDLGTTNSGSDYYFSYGDVLYIILNSNNRNAAEHSALMEKAIESAPDAKWRVVAFHHDIYGSGEPHSDTDGANLRPIFAPLMDEYDIDVCLTGHDHSYARTYQIIDGTAIEYGEDEAVDPEGTLYVAAGSASGSKFYNLATQKQYYIAERSNTQLPTYSTIDFSSGKMTIKTFDYNGDEYAKPFSIVKSGTKESAQSLVKKAEALDYMLYTKESYARVMSAVKEMNKIIAATPEDKGAEKLSTLYDKTVEGTNENDPLNYYASAQGDWAATGSSRLRPGFSALLDRTVLQDLTTSLTQEAYEAAYSELNASLQALEELKTSAPDDSQNNDSQNNSNQNTNSNNQSTNSGNQNVSNNTNTTQNQTVTTAKKASLTIKKGSKKLTSSTTIKLKKGKSFKIKVTKKNTTKKVTYKSANKKIVKVSASGKVTAKKVSKKAIKITVTCGSLKKTFKVRVVK